MVSSDAAGKLSFVIKNRQLEITNPTPFYVNMVNITVGGKTLDSIMATPKDVTKVKLPEGAGNDINFSTVNDFGGVTPSIYSKIN